MGLYDRKSDPQDQTDWSTYCMQHQTNHAIVLLTVQIRYL